MKGFLKVVVLTFVVLFSSSAFADQDKTFRWTAPTEYTDGSPILEGELVAYKIFCNSALVATVGANLREYTMNFTTGEYSCYITAATNFAESDGSSLVTFEAEGNPPLIPLAPMNFTVE